MYMYVVCWEPLMVSSKVFWDPYVFSDSGAMLEPPVQGPDKEVAVKTLFGLALQPVLPDTMRKYTPPAKKIPGASYAPPAVGR
jgi:hypothetical protein